MRRAHARAKEHVHLLGVPDVRDREQRADLHVDFGFLARLARGAFLERLAVLHETRADRPESEPRLDAPFTYQDAVSECGYAADDQLGVAVVDRAAPVADMARKEVAVRNFEDDGRAT